MKHLFNLPYSFAILAILFFSTLVRLFNLGYPAEFVFDERYHVPAVRLIAENDSRAFEWWHQPIYGESNHDWLHPPLAKYIQSFFYEQGSGSVESWRIGSVVFGLFGILLTYVFASLVTKNRLTGLLAALFMSLDGLWLVQSRIAMNDVFVSVLILLSAICYLLYLNKGKKRILFFVGSFLGLALATKWTALFFILGFLLLELINDLKKRNIKVIPWKIFSLLLLPLFVYIATYLPVLLQGKGFDFLIDLHKNIWAYQTGRDSLHAFQSTPAQWIFNLRPTWYWAKSSLENIYAINNPLLVIFYVLSLVISLYTLIIKKTNRRVLSFIIFLYGLSFAGWVFSPRILFYYHYTPAIPFISTLLAVCFQKMYFSGKNHRNYLFLFNVFLLVFVFWIFYPHWISLPVSKNLQEAVYFLLSSWK
jgi:dolichyl-phosphate-mannose-protein mannosyltransferase